MKGELDYRALIAKFLSEDISNSEMDVLTEWLEKDSVNHRIFDEVNELWHETGRKTKLDHFNSDNAWSEISEHLGFGKKKTNRVVILNKKKIRILVAAASVAWIVTMGGLAIWLSERKIDDQIAVTLTKVHTDEGEKAHILLADSTCIFLNSGTSMEYSTNYNLNERTVKLSGEAFFSVNTNPEKPFVVQLGKMSVSATGTRFNVLSYENESRIETTLEEGNIKVTIFGQDTIDVKAGQQVVYFRKTNNAIIREVSTETYTSWMENKLRFNDTPFEEVLRKLGRRYNVVFEVRNSDLLELKYTATFIDESIEDVMSMLKGVSPIKYKIYKRTSINDKQYLKPKIVVEKVKTST